MADETEITISKPNGETLVKLTGHTAEAVEGIILKVSHLQSELRDAQAGRDGLSRDFERVYDKKEEYYAALAKLNNENRALSRKLEESVSAGWALVIMLAAWSVGMFMGYLPHLK